MWSHQDFNISQSKNFTFTFQKYTYEVPLCKQHTSKTAPPPSQCISNNQFHIYYYYQRNKNVWDFKTKMCKRRPNVPVLLYELTVLYACEIWFPFTLLFLITPVNYSHPITPPPLAPLFDFSKCISNDQNYIHFNIRSAKK